MKEFYFMTRNEYDIIARMVDDKTCNCVFIYADRLEFHKNKQLYMENAEPMPYEEVVGAIDDIYYNKFGDESLKILKM